MSSGWFSGIITAIGSKYDVEYTQMLNAIFRSWKQPLINLKQLIKHFTRPISTAIQTEAFSDLKRSRMDLIIENAILRQQLIVLKRQGKRPQLTQGDRLHLIFLSRLSKFWQQALHIVQPDTLLRWHRDLFRRYWRRKSKSKQRKPRISPENIQLIKQLSRENWLWGAERIRGELLKLGIRISKRTIQKFMAIARKKTGQTWKTFLKNQSRHIWACDFTVVHDLLFRPLYIFVIIELQSRRIVHTAITRSPTDAWSAQQLREATPWGKAPKYLIRDRDCKFGSLFSSLGKNSGIKELVTPYKAPKANAVCERFMGSLKRECLDHIFVFHQQQLHRVVKEYVNYYNGARPHQGIQQRRPKHFADPPPLPLIGKLVSTPVLGGLHHDYSRTSHLH
jgi:putative transposase